MPTRQGYAHSHYYVWCLNDPLQFIFDSIVTDIQGLHRLKRLQLETFSDSDLHDIASVISRLFKACSSLEIVDLICLPIGLKTDWYTYSRGFETDAHQPKRTNAMGADSQGKRLGDLWIDY